MNKSSEIWNTPQNDVRNSPNTCDLEAGWLWLMMLFIGQALGFCWVSLLISASKTAFYSIFDAPRLTVRPRMDTVSLLSQVQWIQHLWSIISHSPHRTHRPPSTQGLSHDRIQVWEETLHLQYLLELEPANVNEDTTDERSIESKRGRLKKEEWDTNIAVINCKLINSVNDTLHWLVMIIILIILSLLYIM